jgi:hypothetical protein
MLPNTYASDAPVISLLRAGIEDPDTITGADIMALCMINLDILLTSNDNFIVAGEVTRKINFMMKQNFISFFKFR